MEKPKLDNARKPRGIYFIDPEDEEYGKIIKNARKKLELPAAMPFEMETRKRARKPQESVASGRTEPNKKSKYACIIEAHESTRKLLEYALPRNHELVDFALLTSSLVLVRFVFTRMLYDCWAARSSRIISYHFITDRSHFF